MHYIQNRNSHSSPRSTGTQRLRSISSSQSCKTITNTRIHGQVVIVLHQGYVVHNQAAGVDVSAVLARWGVSHLGVVRVEAEVEGQRNQSGIVEVTPVLLIN